MTGDGDASDDGPSDEVPIAETLDEMLAGDDSGLCAGLLDVLTLLSDVGAARWVLHRAGDLALAAAPGGYGVHEVFAPEVVDAALGDLAEAGLVTIDEAEFDDADDDSGDDDDDDDDVAGGEYTFLDDLAQNHQDDGEGEDDDQEEDYLDDSAFDRVTAVPDAARIILSRHVAAGTIAELGGRACVLLGEAARSAAGIDSALLTDGMNACWDRLRPLLGPADGELVKDLLTMRNWGLYSLIYYPDVSVAGMIEFGEKLVADYEQALGPGHPDAWEARSNMANAYGLGRRHDEAISAFARLCADMEGVFPADDRGNLMARHQLALAYMNAGSYQEAVSEYTQLLAGYERVMGPRHNMTLTVRGELGMACLEAGRTAEGIGLAETAAAGLAAIAGPGFPEVTRLREAIEEARSR
jgi:Tetratricopeptide repeat